MTESRHTNLVCTVSTVKDTPENVLEFTADNLAAGVDHMFVFVDDSAPEVMESLAGHAHVTAIGTGKEYWRGRRPSSLNPRQVTNANVVNVALTTVPAVRWLFHVDGDECLDIDRQALLALDDDVRAVRLTTLEAVSRSRWVGPVTHFKRQLDGDDLCLLTLLGLIEEPELRGHYFRGHLRKAGLRPSLDLRLRLHHVERLDGSLYKPHQQPEAFRVLHYESPSGEEFVRKWMTHVDNGKQSHRGRRELVRSAVRSVLGNPALDDTRRREVLLEVYRRVAEDDFETLDSLGFLVEPDPARHRHRPVPLADEDRRTLTQMLELLSAADHRYFYRDPDHRPADLLRSLRARRLRRSELDRRIDVALSASRA